MAMNASRQYNITGNAKKKSVEKLSSGYKINRAADDAAGLSISEKMRKQIRGLNQGGENVQDGISMCQVADGAAAEVHDMIHRVTELSVQSANGTNSTEDRIAIQREIDQITSEIDRISDTVEFNGMNLFKQRIEQTGSNMTKEEALEEITTGHIKTATTDIVDSDGNVILSKKAANALFASIDCYHSINELYKEYKNGILTYDGQNGVQTSKLANVMDKVANAVYKYGELYDVDVTENVNKAIEYATKYKNASIAYSDRYIENATQYAIFYGSNRYTGILIKIGKDSGSKTNAGYDFAFSMDMLGYTASDAAAYYGDRQGHTYQYRREDFDFTESLKEMISAIKKIPYEDQDKVDDGLEYYISTLNDIDSLAGLYAFVNSDGKTTVYKEKNLWIQSGSKLEDGMYITIDAMDTSLLGMKALDVTTKEGAMNALDAASNATQRISEIRSRIGAQQNRLEHTFNNVKNTEENLQASESRIRDTDMAEEMVNYSKSNIIQQASQSMLVNANQSKQGILTLLQ